MSLLIKILMSPSGLAFDRALVRCTGESLLNRVFARQAGFTPQPALLLETRGRRSGAPRQAVLPWFRIDGKLMVVGSKGGMPTDPAWVMNLRAEPAVAVWIRRKRHAARARIAAGEERAALWAELTARVPTYAHYQSLTTREIPVVVLELAA
jgi:deazaflavin-dependent oxidoreductase (nitroreductase family)